MGQENAREPGDNATRPLRVQGIQAKSILQMAK